MADTANGSVLTFGTAMDVVNFSVNSSSAEIDVTRLSDAEHFYEAGLPDLSLTAEIVGEAELEVGDTDSTASVKFGDGSTTNLTKLVVTSVEKTANLDERITTNVTFRRAR
jgi:hypothetical protein